MADCTFQRRLVRDGLQTPWGFRLQGGKDFNQPLTVQRVFTGSPAEGELQRGDIVIAINNRDTNTITHKEALNIIQRSGAELVLSVQRGPSHYSQSPHTPTTPQVDFHHPDYQNTMSNYHNYHLHRADSHEPQFAGQQNYGHYGGHGHGHGGPSHGHHGGPSHGHGGHGGHHGGHHGGPNYGGGHGGHNGPSYGGGPSHGGPSHGGPSHGGPNYGSPQSFRQSRPQEVPQRAPHKQSSFHSPSASFSGSAPYLAAPAHSPPQQYRYTLPHSNKPAAQQDKQGYRPVQFSTSGPVPASPTKTAGYSVQYGPPGQQMGSAHLVRSGQQQGSMMNRVQQSLADAAYARPEDEEDYDYIPVSQRKAMFQPQGGQRRTAPPQSRGKKWQPPGGGGMNFGWAPSVRPDPSYRPGPPVPDPTDEYKPVRQVGPSRPRQAVKQVFSSPNHMTHHEEPVDSGPPAWKGSLRKAGSSTPSGAFKSVQFNPNQPAGINPIRVAQPQAGVNEGPQVVHLQYNSPIGLYNKSSADEALRGQTAGRPGQGTLMITGGDGKQEIDWKKSHVYQMIHGDGPQGPQAARYADHGQDYEGQYEGFMDHNKQSRSFQMLQNQVEDGEGVDASDF